MKLAFIGDLHLDSQTPISRLDDYRAVTLTKLRSLLAVCIENNVNAVICTGDFFEKYDVPISYLVEVIQVLKEFSNNHVDFYTIIGNHDLPYKNMDYFKSTPLSLLAKSGTVKLLTELDCGGQTIVYGLNFSEKVTTPIKGNTKILVMHYASENTIPGESISLKDLQDFTIVVAGHDHTPYPIIKVGNTVLIRPGSFTRRTKDAYNLTRGITTYIYNTETHGVMIVELPGVAPATSVFKNEVFIDTSISYANSAYDNVFNDLYFSADTQDIYQIIDELPVTIHNESKEIITRYLAEQGILRSENNGAA